MNRQLFTKWYVKYLLLALCAIVLLIIPILKGGLVGSEPFLIERLSNDIGFYDGLSFGGRFAAYEWGTPYVYSLIPDVLTNFFPFILGILTFALFWLILKELGVKKYLQNIALFLLVVSPTFIYIFSFANFLFIPTFLSLAAFYFFIKGNYKYLAIPIVLVLPLFNIFITLSLLFVLASYAFWKKENRLLFGFLLLLAVLVGSAFYGFMIWQSGVPEKIILDQSTAFSFLNGVIFELGALYGIGTFLLILSIIGLVTVWEKKYTNLFMFSSISILAILAIIRTEALLILQFFGIILSAIGLRRLIAAAWSSIRFKNFTLLIIFVALIFSAGAQVDRMLKAEPNQDILNAISFLEEQPQGVVFSHYSRGAWINAAGHRNVLDENYLFVENPNERLKDMNNLFYSRELDQTNPLLDKYSVDYVWVDTGFVDDVWSYETEGMLFVLQYTERFKKVYDSQVVTIWVIERQ